jgi:hypothetical protein
MILDVSMNYQTGDMYAHATFSFMCGVSTETLQHAFSRGCERWIPSYMFSNTRLAFSYPSPFVRE